MRVFLIALSLLLPSLCAAQNFTTSAGVKPILELIRPQWIAIRPYDGQDLLYMTTLLTYRCGIEQIRFSYNGGELQVWDGEPCYWDEASPMALKVETHLPYAVAPLDSLQTVTINLLFDDGTTMEQSYQRKDVQIN
ncbi:hypothetical protein BCF46_1267 [Litoreibacter meonggei]|uniref:Uncharacterized protein n=1 Tax=Litoreibacter meonggei TaxID=1049199 RepID=A0A497X3H6_9RHOB|nr:hypothetical protein [Litoreibacter meonggei]RLJ59123.1 hypothetical protein BCF46_1267 [Litoreibacter meonggei]